MTHQAVQLGFLPRLSIRHTSEHEIGQVYAPGINWTLFVAVVGLVVGFGSSTALANAYGVAVTGTFILNTILFLAVARFLWRKPGWMIGLGGALFLAIETAFFAANLTKVAHGGWLPLAIAAVVFTLLVTWHRGQHILTRTGPGRRDRCSTSSGPWRPANRLSAASPGPRSSRPRAPRRPPLPCGPTSSTTT